MRGGRGGARRGGKGRGGMQQNVSPRRERNSVGYVRCICTNTYTVIHRHTHIQTHTDTYRHIQTHTDQKETKKMERNK